MRLIAALAFVVFAGNLFAADEPAKPTKPPQFTNAQQINEYYGKLTEYYNFHKKRHEDYKTRYEQGGTEEIVSERGPKIKIKWDGIAANQKYLDDVTKEITSLDQADVGKMDDLAKSEHYKKRAGLIKRQADHRRIISDLQTKVNTHVTVPMANIDAQLKAVEREQAAALQQHGASVQHVRMMVDTKRLEDDATEFMNKAKDVDYAYAELGRRYQNSYLKVYMASRLDKLLKGDAICKASQHCINGKQSTSAKLDFTKEIGDAFAEPASATMHTPAAPKGAGN